MRPLVFFCCALLTKRKAGAKANQFQKDEWIERLFVKSETKDTMFHSHVRILLLPDNSIHVDTAAGIYAVENYGYDE